MTTAPAHASALAGPFAARRCPCCGAAGSALDVGSRPAATSVPFEDLVSCWSGFFRRKTFFDYHRCSDCGFLYCPTYFTPAQLEALYSRMPDNTAGVPLAALKRTQAGYFAALKRHDRLTGGYLEVGPDIGLFTECAVREGAYSHHWLFEPNTVVKPALEQLLRGKPCDIHASMFDFHRVPDRAVSTAVMIHVLDHIPDPVPILAQLRAKLAPEAVLLFVTHDESSLMARVLRGRWPAYCLQHPHLFNPTSIARLMRAAGYRVLAVEKSWNWFPVDYLLRHLLFAAGLRVDRLPLVPALPVPLKLGNIVTIAAPAPGGA
jgi:SAM-dependent methyltransferase